VHLTGSITALATPFGASGEVDFPAWRRLLDVQLAAGTRAVVVAGSTGEAATLSDAEYAALVEAAVVQVEGRIPVLAGTGASGTDKTIAQTRLAKAAGAQLALVVTPPYVRPTQPGLVLHYLRVAEEGGLPVVLYNVPGRTGTDMLPDTVAQLCGHPQVVGLKEARGDVERWDALYPLRSAGFALLSGDDPTFLRAVRGGADGVISVASNVVPRAFARIFAALAAGRDDEAGALDARLQPLFDFLGVEPNPIPVKDLLRRLGIGSGLRLPLVPLSDVHTAAAEAADRLGRALESELQ
jgi:4-hydroxy-tetrahydrodipicolinate synthase